MPTPLPLCQRVLAIDPGNVDSAYCYLQGDRAIGAFRKAANADVLAEVGVTQAPSIAIEMVCSYGMPAGASLFDTCVFIGQLLRQAHYNMSEPTVTLLGRIQVKSHLCHSGRATDANIRQALIDLFGAPGTKKNPGATYGISADVWSALAIAETFRSGDYEPYILSTDKCHT